VHELHLSGSLNARVCQQRSSLAVLVDDLSTLEWISANDTGSCNGKGNNKEQSADCECLDPLDCNNDRKELGDSEG
jgi:hypothetical protein